MFQIYIKEDRLCRVYKVTFAQLLLSRKSKKYYEDILIV
jgi:hypothetical protein